MLNVKFKATSKAYAFEVLTTALRQIQVFSHDTLFSKRWETPNDNSATSPTSTCFDHPHEGVKPIYSLFTTQGREMIILYVGTKPFREFHKEINGFQYTRIQRWTTNLLMPQPTLYRTDSFETFLQILCEERQLV
jgi:hypothetical protein